MNENQLRDMIDRATRGPAPTSNLGDVQSRGRRLRIRRYVAAVISGALLLLLLTASLGLLLPLVRDSSQPAQEQPPNSALVMCEGDQTRVMTPEVRPQPDGVHITVDNASDQDLAFIVSGVGAENAPTGTGDTVWALAPGPVDVACHDPDRDAGDAEFARLTIVDPEHLWTPSTLGCASPGGVGMEGARVGDVDVDPLQIAREHLVGIAPTDRLDAAGYPAASTRQVVVVRDDQVIASVSFEASSGSWYLTSLESCPGIDIRWEP